MSVVATMGCGASMWVKIFTPALGWHTLQKKNGLMLGGNSLDAEISGRSMLIESLKKWVDTCVCAKKKRMRWSSYAMDEDDGITSFFLMWKQMILLFT